MAEEEKRVLVPMINVNHNEDDSGLIIKIDLAGASKENTDLDMSSGGFCIKAEGEDFRYESCYMLPHEIKPDEAKAKFNSGLLTVHVPFKQAIHGYKVAIQ
jgi:HSP20 family molecular chaperone IbpA